MSIWNLSNNEALNATGNFESGTSIEPMPEGTQVRACIDEAKWDSYEDQPAYISLRWTVLDGEYKNRKVFQKVRVKDTDTTKRDKQVRMLAAIDANCGGNLMRLGRDPEDMDLMANLSNRPMAIKLGVWEINNKKGNWVMAVSSLATAPQQPQQTAPQPQQAPQQDTGDNIPF